MLKAHRPAGDDLAIAPLPLSLGLRVSARPMQGPCIASSADPSPQDESLFRRLSNVLQYVDLSVHGRLRLRWGALTIRSGMPALLQCDRL